VAPGTLLPPPTLAPNPNAPFPGTPRAGKGGVEGEQFANVVWPSLLGGPAAPVSLLTAAALPPPTALYGAAPVARPAATAPTGRLAGVLGPWARPAKASPRATEGPRVPFRRAFFSFHPPTTAPLDNSLPSRGDKHWVIGHPPHPLSQAGLILQDSTR